MAKKNKKKKLNYLAHILILIAVIAVVFFIGKSLTNLMNRFTQQTTSDVIAVVNGEEITQQELDQKYDKLPAQYKSLFTKEFFLDQLINTKLLLQEAKKQAIVISTGEIDEEMGKVKSTFYSDFEFEEFLKENSLTIEEVKSQLADQLLINKLLNETILSKIEITDQQINNFYNENKDIINDTLENVEEQIRLSLMQESSAKVIQTYIDQLKADADIQLGRVETQPTTPTTLNEFTITADSICQEDGKPIIRLFTTSTCRPCNDIKETFESLATSYKDEIIAYHWQLDTGDNILTLEIETGIPKAEVEIFKKYNEKTTVPTYVFGCKYVRIGNALTERDLAVEKQELTRQIEKLIV